jgi:hypothetical protein
MANTSICIRHWAPTLPKYLDDLYSFFLLLSFCLHIIGILILQQQHLRFAPPIRFFDYDIWVRNKCHIQYNTIHYNNFKIQQQKLLSTSLPLFGATQAGAQDGPSIRPALETALSITPLSTQIFWFQLILITYAAADTRFYHSDTGVISPM